MARLDQSVVLLTGAAGGIGQALAKALSAQGARLALADRNGPGLDALAAALPDGTSTHVVDLTDTVLLERLVADVIDKHGKLSVCICNAGLTVHARFADFSAEEIDRVMDVDLRSVLHLIRIALPHLRDAKDAQIVLISSMAGLQAFPFQSTYSAAKHGLVGYGDALRIELASEQIGVTTVLPGTIATGFLDDAGAHDVQMTNKLAALMKRWGTSPERVATKAVRGILNNRGRVRVGWDCHAVSLTQWVAPPLLPMILRWATRRHLLGGP